MALKPRHFSRTFSAASAGEAGQGYAHVSYSQNS